MQVRAILFATVVICGTGCDEEKQPTVFFDQGTQDQGVTSDQAIRDQGQPLDALACDEAGPVKVLLVVDNSGSTGHTDPHGTRQAQLVALFDHVKQSPSVRFGLISFATLSAVDNLMGDPVGTRVFTADQAEFTKWASMLDRPFSGRSDYVDVLERITAILQHDMSSTPAVLRGATRYVVLFVSDGRPSPVCQEGCDNDGASSHGGECEVDDCTESPWPTSNAVICDSPRDSWCEALGADESLCYLLQHAFNPMRSSCPAYNTDEAILQQVDQLMGLRTAFTIAGLQLHTLRVLADLDQPTRELLDLDPAHGASLLAQMATRGSGLFHDQAQGDLNLTTLDLAHSGCMPTEPPTPNGECNVARISGGGGTPTCDKSEDCALIPSRPLCHPTEKVCVKCLENSDCADQEGYDICRQETNPNRVGVCVQCLTDQQCVKGIGDTGKCATSAYRSSCTGCETDKECRDAGVGMVCDEATKSCQECDANWHCAAGPGKTGFCSDPKCEGCQTNEDCQSAGLGQVCELFLSYNYLQGRCVDCLADDQCAKGPENTGRCAESKCEGCVNRQECEDAFPGQILDPGCI